MTELLIPKVLGISVEFQKINPVNEEERTVDRGGLYGFNFRHELGTWQDFYGCRDE